MRYQKMRLFLRNLRLILAIGLVGGIVVKSFGGEIIDEKKYEEFRDSFVKESSTEETVESEEVPETIEQTIEEIVEETIEEIESSSEEVNEEPEIEETVYVTSSELLDSGYKFKQIDFESLMGINSEVCGWITIDGTKIDYPIVNALDGEKDYYLHHNLERNESSSGTIYVDYRCNSLNNDTKDLNDITFIYGHHSKNGKMFSNICNYNEPDYINDHPYGVIYTPDGYAYKVTFFAGKIHSGESDKLVFVDSLSEEDYDDYIEYLKTYSTFESDVTPEYGDKIVGLVTCEYTQGSNSRYILFGILEKQYTNELQIENAEEEKGLALR